MHQQTRNTNYLIIRILFTLISTITFSTVSAQLISDHQAPPSVEWYQINEQDFNLIYPIELQEVAERTATLLKNNLESISGHLGINPRKIDIILQNQNLNANGYVQLAPRKSEFYTSPPQGGSPDDWIKTLAIHEYRHVVQFDKLTGKIRFPFEELGLAFFGIALPSWFYEGDAVLTETILSNGGRGVLPSWEMNFRANLLEGKSYSYEKDYLGSYKDITPGYYQLGYFMTTKLYRDYGEDIAEKLLSRIKKNPIRPYNFSRSLKKLTGYNSKGWHDQTIRELRRLWEEQAKDLNIQKYTKLKTHNTRFPTAYLYPQAASDGTIYAIRETPLRVNSIVQIDPDGNTKEVIKTGRQHDPYFSYEAGSFVWNEIREDPRFKLRNYSVIHLHNSATGTTRQVTEKSRLFSPALSSHAKLIAAVEINRKNDNFLVIFDSESGREINRISSPDNRDLSHLSFRNDASTVLAIGRHDEGSSIIEFDLANKTSKIILDHQIQEMENPTYINQDILFKAHYNGIDNLYILEPDTKNIRQLTSVKYGAFTPSYQRATRTVLFSNFDGKDYEINRLNLDSTDMGDVNNIDNTFISYFKPLLDTVGTRTTAMTRDSLNVKQRPYKEIKHLFNFHSISINDGEYDNLTDYKPGLFFLSNNLMNTLAMKIGGTYDPDIHSLNFHSQLTYSRYYPRFSIGYHNREQFSNIQHPQSKEVHAVRWREHYSQFQIQLPFSINQLNYNYNFDIGIASSYTSRYNISRADFQNVFIKHIEFPMHYQVGLGRNARRAPLDLAPRWGQNILLGYRHLPFSELSGTRFALRSTFYFPGLATNHSTQVRFNLQERDGVFSYENIIPMVSGFAQLKPTQPQNTLFLNYKFPLAYPDFQLGSLAYVKRIKANLFTDFEDFSFKGQSKPRTYGIELLADVNLLRFLLPEFELGAKAVVVNEDNPERFILQYSLSYSY